MEKIMNQAHFNWCFHPPHPLNPLSFPYLNPIKFSPGKSQPHSSSCAVERLPIFQVSISLVPRAAGIWQFSYTVGWLMMSTWKRQYHQQPIFSRCFLLWFLKILSEHFKRKSPWRASPAWHLSLLGGCLCRERQTRRVSCPFFLTCWVKQPLGFPTALRSHCAVIHPSDGQCSEIRHRMLKLQILLWMKCLCFQESHLLGIHHSPLYLPSRVRVFSLQDILWCSNVKCYTTPILCHSNLHGTVLYFCCCC